LAIIFLFLKPSCLAFSPDATDGGDDRARQVIACANFGRRFRDDQPVDFVMIKSIAPILLVTAIVTSFSATAKAISFESRK
jgi:hypothetical protein